MLISRIFNKINPNTDKFLLKFEQKFSSHVSGALSMEILKWLFEQKIFTQTVTDGEHLYLRFDSSKDLILFKLRWS